MICNAPQTITENYLRFLGHNCYLIENAETFLLIDPWLTNKGAFFGSWFQYPKNHHLRDEIIDLSKKKTGYVYYTHEHEDHFDIETLSLLDPKTKVIIPEYKDRFLFKTITSKLFDCIELPEGSTYSLGSEITLRIFISEVGINRDSAILVKTKNFVFFNQNDCKIFDRLNEIEEKITYYTVQFSGATGHPVCYTNYTDKEKAAISLRKNNNKLTNVVKAIKLLSPDYYIPAAGPAIFPYLDPFLSYGKDNIFIHQDTLNSTLVSNDISYALYPTPGDIICDSLAIKKYTPPPSPCELSAYKVDIFDFWENYNPEFSEKYLEEAINNRLDKIWDLDFECDTLLQFQWGNSADEQITIDLQAKQIVSQDQINGKVYVLSAEKKYFVLMYSGYRWQDIYLSLRAKPYRNPDEFNNFINLFLFSDPENIRDSFITSLSISNERILKQGQSGVCYEINRYCPHQGADLSGVDVNERNEIVCPRHGWRFSLDNNGNTNNGSYSLCAKVLKPNRL